MASMFVDRQERPSDSELGVAKNVRPVRLVCVRQGRSPTSWRNAASAGSTAAARRTSA